MKVLKTILETDETGVEGRITGLRVSRFLETNRQVHADEGPAGLSELCSLTRPLPAPALRLAGLRGKRAAGCRGAASRRNGSYLLTLGRLTRREQLGGDLPNPWAPAALHALGFKWPKTELGKDREGYIFLELHKRQMSS